MIVLVVSGSVVLAAVIAVVVFIMVRKSRKTGTTDNQPKIVTDDSNVTQTKIEPLG